VDTILISPLSSYNMPYKASNQQVLATWKDEIKGKDAIGMLPISAQAFSGFNIHISVAILDSADYVVRKVENQAWRPRFRAYSDKQELTRAMLIIKKEKTGRWELPHGKLTDLDVDINAALERIVLASTGLHVSRVLGSPISPPSWQRNGRWHYELLYVAVVNEVTSIDTLADFRVQLPYDYIEHRWVRSKDEISMLPDTNISIIQHAFAFQPKVRHPTMAYLSMTPDDAMPYAGTFSYLIAAAIIRSSPGPPAILLLHRSQLPQDPASFELVGGAIFIRVLLSTLSATK